MAMRWRRSIPRRSRSMATMGPGRGAAAPTVAGATTRTTAFASDGDARTVLRQVRCRTDRLYRGLCVERPSGASSAGAVRHRAGPRSCVCGGKPATTCRRAWWRWMPAPAPAPGRATARRPLRRHRHWPRHLHVRAGTVRGHKRRSRRRRTPCGADQERRRCHARDRLRGQGTTVRLETTAALTASGRSVASASRTAEVAVKSAVGIDGIVPSILTCRSPNTPEADPCGGIVGQHHGRRGSAHDGLTVLQHRGQDAAGIATANGTQLRVHKTAGARRVQRQGDVAAGPRRHRALPLPTAGSEGRTRRSRSTSTRPMASRWRTTAT